MSDRVCIVTGAGAGIGVETAKGLAQKGATVVMACRNTTRAEPVRAEIARTARSNKVHLLELDLASLSSIRKFAAEFREHFGRLDTLVSNAGVVPGHRRLTTDGFEEALAVNFLGPVLLVDLLLPLLRISSEPRVIFMGGSAEKSGKIAWDDLQSNERYQPMAALGQSRLALMLYVRELVRRNPGIAINVVDPGPTRTGVLKEMPTLVRLLSLLFKSPAKAALTPLWLATAPKTAQVTGKYFKDLREVRSSEASRDDSQAKRLWDTAATLVVSGEHAEQSSLQAV